jgi:hypothetical protein
MKSLSMAALLLISLLGFSLALQGWKGRIPPSDMLPYFDAAERLVTRGEIPTSGALTSYSSFAPPGPSWLIAPGLLLFSEPRLFESVGSAVLYFGTLLGIFLLARLYFGEGCALLAAAIYGLSELGLEVGSSLYVRFSMHFFYVWLAYWIVQWVTRKNANYLAAAILTWFAGMYIYMEIAPALFIVPAAWSIYRPPVKFFPLATAGILAFAIWFPYLNFEYSRNFADVKSQVTRTTLRPINYKDSWCDPTLVMRDWSANASAANVVSKKNPDVSAHDSKVRLAGVYGLFGAIYALIERFSHPAILLPNFERVASIPGSHVALLLLVLASIVLLSLCGTALTARAPLATQESWRSWLNPIAIALIVLAVVGNEFVAKRLSSDGAIERHTVWVIRQLQVLVGLIGVSLLQRKRLIAAARQLPVVQKIACYAKTTEDVKPLLLSMVVPWLILFLVVEADRGDRFWWFWPLQVIALVALFSYALPRLGTPRWATYLGEAALFLLIAGNPLVMSRAHSWLTSGWSGSDPDELRALDYVASDIRATGRKEAAVGYQIFIWGFMPGFNIIDSRYKVGADFDFVLHHRHRLSNTDRCAEGLSPNDQYRIVALRPTNDIPAAQKYFAASVTDSFHRLSQFGVYQVLKRN